MQKQNDILLIENRVDIDLLEDYWTYQKAARESYYCLKSLYIMLTTNLIISGDGIEEEVDKRKEKKEKLVNKSKDYIEKYEKFEKDIDNGEFCLNATGKLDELISETLDKSPTEGVTYCIYLYETTILAIDFKSKFDKLQLEILEFVNRQTEIIIQMLIGDRVKLKHDFLIRLSRSLTRTQLEHSVDEDKKDTYVIGIKNKNLLNLPKVNTLGFPKYYSSIDYTYNLFREKEKYANYNELLVYYMGKVEEEKENELREKRDAMQYKFNKWIVGATVITTITAIVTIVIEILTYKYK